MNAERLFAEFERLGEAEGAAEQLRRLVRTLGIRGELTVRGVETARSLAAIHAGLRSLLKQRPRYRWSPSPPETDGASIPEGWRMARLGDTGLYVNGVAFKPSDWEPTGRPIIRIQNLSGMSTDYNLTTREVGPDNVVRPDDLLVSWSATLDTFIWAGPEAVLNQHIFKVIPNDAAVSRRFLYWLLKHEIRELAESQHAHGLGMMHINRGPFLSHLVALPPLEEQDRIAAKVDEMMALCDQLEAAQAKRERRRNRLAESLGGHFSVTASEHRTKKFRDVARLYVHCEYRWLVEPRHVSTLRAAILDAAVWGRVVPQDPGDEPASETLRRYAREKAAAGRSVTGREWVKEMSDPGPGSVLPSGWAWAHIGRAVERVTVGHVGPMVSHYAQSGVPFVRSQNVRANHFTTAGLVFITREFHERIRKSALAPGDVVVVRSGNVGTSCVIPDDLPEANCSDVVIIKRPVAVLPEYLSFYLNSAASHYVRTGSVGVALTHFNTKSVATMPLALPPLAEQRRIVARTNDLMAVCEELERALAAVQTGRARALESVLAEVLQEPGPRAAVDRTAA